MWDLTVLKGYTKIEELDIYETFAPITMLVSIHYLLLISPAKGWVL